METAQSSETFVITRHSKGMMDRVETVWSLVLLEPLRAECDFEDDSDRHAIHG